MKLAPVATQKSGARNCRYCPATGPSASLPACVRTFASAGPLRGASRLVDAYPRVENRGLSSVAPSGHKIKIPACPNHEIQLIRPRRLAELGTDTRSIGIRLRGGCSLLPSTESSKPDLESVAKESRIKYAMVVGSGFAELIRPVIWLAV